MDAKKIYESAKESVVKIKAAVPSYSSEEGMEFCVIADNEGNLYSAMTNITVKDGNVSRIPADVAAFLYMKNEGAMVASYVIVISVADRRIVPPSDECFDLMFRTNSKNDECVVVLSSSEQKPLSELRLIGDGTDFMTGFEAEEEKDEEKTASDETAEDEDEVDETEEEPEIFDAPDEEEADSDDEDEEDEEEEEVQAEDTKPAPSPKKSDKSSDFISGVQIDESNPFYAAPTTVKPPEDVVALFSEQPEDDLLAPADDDDAPQQPQLSKEELLKQAKKRKKVAKANFLFRKRK